MSVEADSSSTHLDASSPILNYIVVIDPHLGPGYTPTPKYLYRNGLSFLDKIKKLIPQAHIAPAIIDTTDLCLIDHILASHDDT